MKNKRLIIIGAGPKALAIATKNKVLKDLGFRTPQVVIIEKKRWLPIGPVKGDTPMGIWF